MAGVKVVQGIPDGWEHSYEKTCELFITTPIAAKKGNYLFHFENLISDMSYICFLIMKRE